MKRSVNPASGEWKSYSFAIIFVALIAIGISNANAQNSDEVHVVPHERPSAAAPLDQPQEVLDSSREMLAPSVKVQVDLVLVPVTVTDAMNHAVLGLNEKDFSVYEDEKRQQIRYFSSEDSPLSVGILLDVSGTMSNTINAAREALADFFKNAHPDDDYFVITFADHPQMAADSAHSIGDIQGSLATMKPYGYTALLDAVHMGLMKLKTARYQRRALLIISDGGENSSRHKMREVRSEIVESDVEVYAIGLFDNELPGLPVFRSFDEKLGKRLLNALTEASGGRTIAVESLAKLPEAAAAISTEMRNQYVLGYRPTNTRRNGKWRRIKVRVAAVLREKRDDTSLHPAYKQGYVAPQK